MVSLVTGVSFWVKDADTHNMKLNAYWRSYQMFEKSNTIFFAPPSRQQHLFLAWMHSSFYSL